MAEPAESRPTIRPEPVIRPLAIRGRLARPQPRGLPIVNLSYNELPFGPSEKVSAAIAEAAAKANRYGSTTCDPLRHAIGETNGIDPDRIICGNGSEELLDVIGRAFVGAGEEIVISEYGYIQFSIVANRVGARLTKVAETDLATDIDRMIAAISPETKLVFLADPNNPTGTKVGIEAIERLIRSVGPSTLVVVDLAYGEFAGDGFCAAVHALADRTDNVLVTRTFSKAYGLAGVRAGWCQAPAWMMPVLYAARGMGSVNGIAQAAALAALDEPDLVAERVATVVSERERLSVALPTFGLVGPTSATSFFMTGFEDGDPARAEFLAEHLFDDAGILVNRTREAGLERFIRFSLGLPEENDLLLGSLARFEG